MLVSICLIKIFTIYPPNFTQQTGCAAIRCIGSFRTPVPANRERQRTGSNVVPDALFKALSAGEKLQNDFGIGRANAA